MTFIYSGTKQNLTSSMLGNVIINSALRLLYAWNVASGLGYRAGEEGGNIATIKPEEA